MKEAIAKFGKLLSTQSIHKKKEELLFQKVPLDSKTGEKTLIRNIKVFGTKPPFAITQRGNFMIFQSLRFYVKSILGIQEVQNLPL